MKCHTDTDIVKTLMYVKSILKKRKKKKQKSCSFITRNQEELGGPRQAVVPKALYGEELGLGHFPLPRLFSNYVQADFHPFSLLWLVSHSEIPVSICSRTLR